VQNLQKQCDAFGKMFFFLRCGKWFLVCRSKIDQKKFDIPVNSKFSD